MQQPPLFRSTTIRPQAKLLFDDDIQLSHRGRRFHGRLPLNSGDTTMTRSTFGRLTLQVDRKRWSAYAIAGLATAMAGQGTAEADVNHAIANQMVDHTQASGSAARYGFSLTGGASFSVVNYYIGPGSEAFAGFQINGATAGTAMFGGYITSGYNNSRYVNNHAHGGLVSAINFITNQPGGIYGSFGMMASQIWGPFVNPGVGFVGFKFDVGQGTQYGWAQVIMNGPQLNSFTLVDYAYADPGESISFGQVPEPGALGVLSLGAVGLLAWRKRKTEQHCV